MLIICYSVRKLQNANAGQGYLGNQIFVENISSHLTNQSVSEIRLQWYSSYLTSLTDLLMTKPCFGLQRANQEKQDDFKKNMK